MNKVYEGYIDEYKQKLKESYFYAKDTLFNRLYGFDDRGEFAIEVLDKLLELQQRIDKALDKISKLKPFIPNEIPTWLDELENILEGKDE